MFGTGMITLGEIALFWCIITFDFLWLIIPPPDRWLNTERMLVFCYTSDRGQHFLSTIWNDCSNALNR